MDKIIPPIKSRVLDFLKSQKIKKVQFNRETGLSLANYKGVGLKCELGGDKITRILTSYPELNPEWLLLGTGNMLKNMANHENLSSGEDFSVNLFHVKSDEIEPRQPDAVNSVHLFQKIASEVEDLTDATACQFEDAADESGLHAGIEPAHQLPAVHEHRPAAEHITTIKVLESKIDYLEKAVADRESAIHARENTIRQFIEEKSALKAVINNLELIIQKLVEEILNADPKKTQLLNFRQRMIYTIEGLLYQKTEFQKLLNKSDK